MISPKTPPGTDVVCVWGGPPDGGLPGLTAGDLYTVDRIVSGCGEDRDDFGVIIVGHGVGRTVTRGGWRSLWRRPQTQYWAYRLECFRYVDLAGLDALLDTRAKADV